VRRAVVRAGDFRPSLKPRGFPRPAHRHHRRRGLGVRLGAAAPRPRQGGDAHPSERQVSRARGYDY
jgi:hypothetical protein